jgi:hypothetical protein
MTDFIAGLADSPQFYPQKFDLVRDAVLLMAMRSADYQAASFLDDRIVSAATQAQWVPYAVVAQAMAQPQNPRPLHFIFHSGHVGSTLLSRVLDETAAILSLREPLTLRTFADAHDALIAGTSLMEAAQFDARLETVLRAWSRGYDATRAVVVKATSVASRFAPSLLTRRPAARAIYLNLRAEPFLATLLAGANSAIDLNGHAPLRYRRLQNVLGPDVPALSSLSLGELAALSWLVETLTEAAVVRQFGPRILTIDFDQLLAAPVEAVAAALRQFALDVPHDLADMIARSAVLTRYSKAPEHAYSPQLRTQLLDQARVEHAAELRKGLDLLDRLGAQHGAVAAVL